MGGSKERQLEVMVCARLEAMAQDGQQVVLTRVGGEGGGEREREREIVS